MTKSTHPKATHIGKTLVGYSVKRRCQRCFVANKPYLDHSLCLLIYENAEHLNAVGEHCHGTMVGGFIYALGASVLDEMKHKIAEMHAYELSPAQIMQQHTKEAVLNRLVTRDTFLLLLDVTSIYCKRRKTYGWKIYLTASTSVCGLLRIQKACYTTRNTR